jgi:Fe-S-cluster containining protein
MLLEKSIRRIEELTRRNDRDNERYRLLLKECGLSSEDIDAIVRRHYRIVSREIDCLECGNCCRAFRPLLTPDDVNRLIRRFEIPRADFVSQYLISYRKGAEYAFRCAPCPFLSGNSCSVYPDRPEVCRAYPTTNKPGFISRFDRTLANCSVCPIVYNVFERVKQEIRARTVKLQP